MSKNLTNAEYTLLGLLVEKPAHGYDLEVLIEQRGMREWTELAFSSIYYILKRLEKRAIINQISPAPGLRKTRKTYAPTEQGRKIHQQMTLQLLARPNSGHPPILLGLANWPSVSQSAALEALEQRKSNLGAVLENLTNKKVAQPPFVDVLFDFSIRQIEAELQWLDEALKKLGENT